MRQTNVPRFRELNEKCQLKFVYTPVHGVGLKYTPRAFAAFGFPTENVIFDPKQKDPDPDFPTAPFPNPEEGEKVLVSSEYHVAYLIF